MEPYDVTLAVAGLAALGVALLPRLLHDLPLSFPVIYVLAGVALFTLPTGLVPPHPLDYRSLTERLAEAAVIVALMGAGLQLDRRIGLRSWSYTWRLLGITMPLTIAATAALAWLIGVPVPAAILLGAALAPTDPVLASDVQTGGPGTGEEDEVRFTLTAEAGLNDGLAFPFTNMALLMGLAGIAPANWIGEWLLVEVLYKIAGGIAVGWIFGWLIARLVFGRGARTRLAETSEGLVALAATFLAYGVAELLHTYGFIAVFVAALALRDYEREHEYHGVLHDFSDQAERLLSAVLLILLGGAVVGGILLPLTLPAALVGLAIVFLVRPLAGLAGLTGARLPLRERFTISFFGIRGIGSIYYLAHALSERAFLDEELLWAIVAFVILLSIGVHGATAKAALDRLEDRRAA